MEFDFTTDLWAVVGCFNRYYIGELGKFSDAVRGTVMEDDDGWTEVHHAFQLIDELFWGPPTQPGEGPKPAGKSCLAIPLATTSGDMTIRVRATELWYLKDMNKKDRLKFEEMITNAAAMAQASRVKESGLVMPARGPIPPMKQ